MKYVHVADPTNIDYSTFISFRVLVGTSDLSVTWL